MRMFTIAIDGLMPSIHQEGMQVVVWHVVGLMPNAMRGIASPCKSGQAVKVARAIYSQLGQPEYTEQCKFWFVWPDELLS